MSRFIPLHPCPLCDKTDGRCRETETGLILCMTLTTVGDRLLGWRCIKLSRDGHWGVWIPDDGQYDPQAEAERQRELQIIRAVRAKAEIERRANAMPVVERDRHYRVLLDSLTLHPLDRADLTRRGLTGEQIKRAGFKSVEQWQQLDCALPHTLPGVQLDGRSLNAQPGYLCPIRNTQGQIVACQVRLREETAGRYRWLTSATKKRPNGATPHYKNGELPLAVFRPSEVDSEAIALCEGTAAKPFILSERLNRITVGAAGGQFASSPHCFKVTLDKLSKELETRRLELYPDAGCVKNPGVMEQYCRMADLVKSWGFELGVMWWGQVEKGLDPDELFWRVAS
ncbi:hypothetical protein [Leptolyngbya sp. FACHB-16]|uniref:hypothetical protein n=1 Tax=unclassified Leptolyngbya TaxID=2650499 RepID=UPI001686CAD7|nr:hypothetical protein [Leptolyngbya sp. FACHB-16]MBD2156035.1 hypothetical protein [Leptolyngbya sp. FACHB-16]